MLHSPFLYTQSRQEQAGAGRSRQEQAGAGRSRQEQVVCEGVRVVGAAGLCHEFLTVLIRCWEGI